MLKEAVVLDINQVSLRGNEAVYFGSSSDVIIPGMMDSAFSLVYDSQDSVFHWRMQEPLYLKINDTTVNAVGVDSISAISFSNFRLPIQAISKYIEENNPDKKAVTRYIRLSDVLKKAGIVFPDRDSCNTLLVYWREIPKLILLDESIVVVTKRNTTISYQNSGSVKKPDIKLAFFQRYYSSLLQTDDDIPAPFRIGDTNYYNAVKPFYTPFGADELMVSADSNEQLKIRFNKVCRSVIPIEVIKKGIDDNFSNPVPLRQSIHSSPWQDNIYITNISNRDDAVVGYINESLQFEPKAGRNSLVQKHDYTSHLLKKSDFLKALIPLTLIFIVGCILIWKWLTCGELFEVHSNHSENEIWRAFYIITFAVLYILSVGRIYVGYNLSFTSPYFDFAFPTSVVVSSLVLLAVLLIWTWFIAYNTPEALAFRKKVVVLVSLGLLTIIFVHAFRQFPEYIHNPGLFSIPMSAESINRDAMHYFTLQILTVFVLVVGACLFFSRKIPVKWILPIFIFCFFIGFFFIFRGKNSMSALFCLAFLWLTYFIYPGLKKLRWATSTGQPSPIEKPWKRFVIWCFYMLPLAIVAWLSNWQGDPGYSITLFVYPVVLCIVLFWSHVYNSSLHEDIHNRETRWQRLRSIVIVIGVIGFLLWIGKAMTANYDPHQDSRMHDRLTTFYNFDKVHEYGIRASEKHSQFFAILSKYSYPAGYNAFESIHPGISSFSDPVVVNDLSVPFGLISPFGNDLWYLPVLILILLWSVFFLMTMRMALYPYPPSGSNVDSYFTVIGLLRVCCASMIFANGMWLLCSYYGIVPFTGRLIYGLGQDSIGEVFETIFLFAVAGFISKVE